jgi:hypothetical protein
MATSDATQKTLVQVQKPSERPELAAVGLLFIRFVLPMLIAVSGIIVLGVGGADRLDGGLGLLTASFCTFMLNLAYRVSASDTEREAEEAARDFFTEHGWWPDETPQAGTRRRPGS